MNIRVFSVYDRKACLYTPPFYYSARGQAVRQFKDWANDKSTTVGRYPDDFDLYELGSFDDQTGIFVGFEPAPYLVISGRDVREDG